MSQQGSHSKVYRAGTNEKTPASRDTQPSIIPRLFSPGQESDRGGRTAALRGRSEVGGGGHLGHPRQHGSTRSPARHRNLCPHTDSALPPGSLHQNRHLQVENSHSTAKHDHRGAVSNRLSSKMGQTLAGRRNDTSEKWALIACTAGQACPMSTGSHSIATHPHHQLGRLSSRQGQGTTVLVTVKLLEIAEVRMSAGSYWLLCGLRTHSPHQELPAHAQV